MLSYFLGANSAGGFFSLFGDLSGDISVLKGTAGSGKSTLLRSVAASERIYCTGDISSLDGVITEDGRVLLDGTAPHVCEPTVGGKYIVMPQSGEIKRFREKAEAIRKNIKECWNAAYTALAGVGFADRAAAGAYLPCLDAAKLRRRAENLVTGRKTGGGKLRRRFIDAFCAEGFVTLRDTVYAQADEVVAVAGEEYAACIFMEALAKAADARGEEAVLCLSPLFPDRIRHILFPARRVAFVTNDSLGRIEPTRTVHLSCCEDKAALASRRERLRLLQKLKNELLLDAYAHLREAKALHGELEGLYRPFLDFAALDKMAAELDF